MSRHAQLRAALIHCINAGHWRSGERLPTEMELVALSDFSLGTIQRALRSVAEEGIADRQQGSGTYVADQPHRIDDVAFARFLENNDERLLSVYSRVLTRRSARRTGALARLFPNKDARVLRIDRVLDVNGEFGIFSRFYFDGNRFKGLAQAPLSDFAGANFKVLLGRESNLPVGDTRQTLQLIEAPDEIAIPMRIKSSATVGLLEIIRTDAGGKEAVFFQQLFIPASNRRLQLLPLA